MSDEDVHSTVTVRDHDVNSHGPGQKLELSCGSLPLSSGNKVEWYHNENLIDPGGSVVRLFE